MKRRTRVVLAVGVTVVVVLGIFAARDILETTHGRPTFTSLADHPDPSLHGTVAYVDESRCIQVVAAAGGPSKQVTCVPAMDVKKAVKTGAKDTDPQLVWMPDGRLEVTVFHATMRKQAEPTLSAGWQKIVDVRTGAIEDVPAGAVPATPNLSTRPTVSPDGRRITATSDSHTGRIKITLTDPDGTRTLLSAHGPGSYTYGLNAAFWSPDFSWVAADDGRILVITTGAHPITRVLVDHLAEGGGPWAVGYSSFAVTKTDVPFRSS